MKSCHVVELGSIRYGDAWALQQRLVAARKAGAIPDVLLLCEHPHVVTLGRNGKLEHLHATPDALCNLHVEFFHSDRGGDITYHGPGQLVGYPILNLAEIRRDVAWYMRQLEEVMMRASASFGIETVRIPGCTGVWVKSGEAASELACGPQRSEEKLGAIGVHLSRWVTSHGFAYNVCTDLRYFDLIVPCGIANCRTASLDKLLGRPVTTMQVAPGMTAAFGEAFALDMISSQHEEMEDWLSAVPQPTVVATR